MPPGEQGPAVVGTANSLDLPGSIESSGGTEGRFGVTKKTEPDGESSFDVKGGISARRDPVIGEIDITYQDAIGFRTQPPTVPQLPDVPPNPDFAAGRTFEFSDLKDIISAPDPDRGKAPDEIEPKDDKAKAKAEREDNDGGSSISERDQFGAGGASSFGGSNGFL